ncbi:YjaG family protein [Seminibacterium arietis]|uniref:YjaG family protein n=1 Tax=Seminibacterium arietis TaxID=1173502 RepID=A0ABW3I9T4_9PAST
MQNPIHKRLANLESWQHLTFMACLCSRMYPNFHLFCKVTNQPEKAKIYYSILNLVWEFLTVKGAKINFENQLEKLENIIPNINDYDFYGIFPAIDSCESLAETLHSIIAGSTLEQAIRISQISLHTVASMLEMESDHELSEQELRNSEAIQQELDLQWQIYRILRACEKRDIELILDLKSELVNSRISNIGVEIKQ